MYVYQCVSMSRCLQSLLSHTPVCTAAGEKMALFESATRVPLLIRAPWLPRSIGAISAQVVELVSLYRTLAELAGVQEVEASVQGHSFANLLITGDQTVGRSGGGGGPEDGLIGYALSQMTRCAKASANATQLHGFDPCAKTPGARKGYTYMGYSVRSSEWRLSIWTRWDNVTQCPDWDDPSNVVEL